MKKTTSKQDVIKALRAAAAKLQASAAKKAEAGGTRVKARSGDGQVFIGAASSPTLGAWITPDGDEDTLAEQIDQVLAKIRKREPDVEEWIVADYDDFPNLGENPSLANLAAIAAALDDHDLEIVNAALDYAGGKDVDGALKALKDGYAVYDSETAYAEQYVEEAGVENIKNLDWYLDFEKLGRDLIQDESYTPLGGDRIVLW